MDDGEEDLVLLRHMVLSHHGKLEYGSPVAPRILEAEVLSSIDDLDAKVKMISDAMDGIGHGEITPRLAGINNQNFYKR
jgi:3'-5' exoribonuclease